MDGPSRDARPRLPRAAATGRCASTSSAVRTRSATTRTRRRSTRSRTPRRRPTPTRSRKSKPAGDVSPAGEPPSAATPAARRREPPRGALAAGAAVLALVAAAVSLAWISDSPLVPDAGRPVHGGVRRSSSRCWPPPSPLSSAGSGCSDAAAALSYAAGCRARRRDPARPARRAAPPLDRCLDVLGVRLDRTIGDGNPYADPPERLPGQPAPSRVMGADWRDTTSVYGPAFTLVSQPVAALAGDSERRGRLDLQGARRRRRRGVRVCSPPGWLGSRAFARRLRRLEPAAGRPSRGWRPQRRAGSAALSLRALGARARPAAAARAGCHVGARGAREVGAGRLSRLVLLARAGAAAGGWARLGLAAGARGAALATWQFGLDWVGAFVAAGRERRHWRRATRFRPARAARRSGCTGRRSPLRSRPSPSGWRCSRARPCAAGRASARRRVLILVTTPWLAVWYLAWAVAARGAQTTTGGRQAACLALCAYLLPQGIPLCSARGRSRSEESLPDFVGHPIPPPTSILSAKQTRMWKRNRAGKRDDRFTRPEDEDAVLGGRPTRQRGPLGCRRSAAAFRAGPAETRSSSWPRRVDGDPVVPRRTAGS